MHYLQEELYQQLRERDEIFDFIRSASLDGLWYWDLTQPEHEWMSPEFWATFGYDPAQREHLAAEWQDLIHPDDLAVALTNFEAHCADPAHPYDQYVRYRHRLGHWVWVRCRGLAIRDDEGTPVRMLGAHIDVTEIMASRKQVEGLLAQAEHMNRDLSLFAYAASHDLQSPLKTLSGLFSLLKLEAAGLAHGEAAETVANIDRTLTKMQGLLDSILFMAQQAPLSEPEAFPLQQIVDDAAADLNPSVENVGGTIDVVENVTLHVHRNLMVRALANLFSNAIKFRRDDAALHIRVESCATDNGLCLRVSDNGQGIPAGKLEEVFGLFVSHGARGHGMGLAIVRKVAQLHGGSVSARGLDPGVCIELNLPQKKD